MKKTKIFIDGKEGTTGLRIFDRLNIREDIELITLPEEKRNKIRASLAIKILKEHPEWAGQTDTTGTDLARAISMMMPFQMGDSYLIEDQNTQQQLNSTAPVAQQVAGYTPQTVDMNDPNAWAQPSDDDLPF